MEPVSAQVLSSQRVSDAKARSILKEFIKTGSCFTTPDKLEHLRQMSIAIKKAAR